MCVCLGWGGIKQLPQQWQATASASAHGTHMHAACPKQGNTPPISHYSLPALCWVLRLSAMPSPCASAIEGRHRRRALCQPSAGTTVLHPPAALLLTHSPCATHPPPMSMFMCLQLKDDNFDVLFVSPLQRAKQTADIVAAGRDLPANMLPALREIDLYSFQVCSDPCHAVSCPTSSAFLPRGAGRMKMQQSGNIH